MDKETYKVTKNKVAAIDCTNSGTSCTIRGEDRDIDKIVMVDHDETYIYYMDLSDLYTLEIVYGGDDETKQAIIKTEINDIPAKVGDCLMVINTDEDTGHGCFDLYTCIDNDTSNPDRWELEIKDFDHDELEVDVKERTFTFKRKTTLQKDDNKICRHKKGSISCM